MRHRVAGKKLSRQKDHRKALFKNLINSLILHGEVKTTESKAKAVRRLVEKVITKGKDGSLHVRRLLNSFLQNKKAVNKIADVLGPLFKNRPGGYTRIVRLGKRHGDDAMMVKLELVEKPEKPEEPEKSENNKKELVQTPKKKRLSLNLRKKNKDNLKKPS